MKSKTARQSSHSRKSPRSTRGGGGSQAFRDTVVGGIDRGNVMFLMPRDSRHYLSVWSRQRGNEKVEWLYQNFPLVGELGHATARHSVGKGITLVIDSEDHVFAAAAEADFADYAIAPDRCDIEAKRSLYDAQAWAVEQFAVFTGEFFASYVRNDRWDDAPAFQIHDTSEIGSGSCGDDDVVDGVRLDKRGRALEYLFEDDSPAVPAGQICHWMKPHLAHQPRGYSPLLPAVNPLVDCHEMGRLVNRNAKTGELVALVLKGLKRRPGRGHMGGLKRSVQDSDGNDDKTSAQLEQIYGGAGAGIISFDDKEGDAEFISSESPNEKMEPWLRNVLLRGSCLAAGLPMEFIWDLEKIGGGPLRLLNSKADLFFQITSDDLNARFCTPLAWRYLEHRIKAGKLVAPRAPYRILWQCPERVTADTGHDTDSKLSMMSQGGMNLRELHGNRGLNWTVETRQWIREPLIFLEIARAELDARVAKGKLTPAIADSIFTRWAENLPLWRAHIGGSIAKQESKAAAKQPD